MSEKMNDKEKMLLLQLLLESMRGSFPLSGWDDERMTRAYDLANELGLTVHANRIKELADYDDYRDGRHFRTDFKYGGYEGMGEHHGLPHTYEDKSTDFQRQARTYITYPEYAFTDWKEQPHE